MVWEIGITKDLYAFGACAVTEIGGFAAAASAPVLVVSGVGAVAALAAGVYLCKCCCWKGRKVQIQTAPKDDMYMFRQPAGSTMEQQGRLRAMLGARAAVEAEKAATPLAATPTGGTTKVGAVAANVGVTPTAAARTAPETVAAGEVPTPLTSEASGSQPLAIINEPKVTQVDGEDPKSDRAESSEKPAESEAQWRPRRRRGRGRGKQTRRIKNTQPKAQTPADKTTGS